jgi:hypothetical protein
MGTHPMIPPRTCRMPPIQCGVAGNRDHGEAVAGSEARTKSPGGVASTGTISGVSQLSPYSGLPRGLLVRRNGSECCGAMANVAGRSHQRSFAQSTDRDLDMVLLNLSERDLSSFSSSLMRSANERRATLGCRGFICIVGPICAACTALDQSAKFRPQIAWMQPKCHV